MTTNDENELICEKLLGWKREQMGCVSSTTEFSSYWKEIGGTGFMDTPTFETWSMAGLIIEAMKTIGFCVYLNYRSDIRWECCLGRPTTLENYCVTFFDTGPLAIRRAALEYLKRLDANK